MGDRCSRGSDADGNLLYDDPPLCEMFRLSRWIPGRAAPKSIGVRNITFVQPPGDLPLALAEISGLRRLRSDPARHATVETISSSVDVLDSFRAGGTQLYHFACHGNFDVTDPDESKLRLADGFMTASQLIGDRESGLRRSKPLVFLNACHSGRRGQGLTPDQGLGGALH